MTLSVPDFTRVGVLVVGDVMLDDYWFGSTSRISPEAPVPVVRVTAAESRPGGAANVAMNLARLGARTTLAGVVGDDANGARLQSLLAGAGVRPALVKSAGRPTITKLRVLSRNQQLIRLDTEDHFSEIESTALVQQLAGHGAGNAVWVISDYAKGALGRVGDMIAAARKASVPVLVDPKGADFARYRGATLLTPNLAEFEAVVGDARDDDDIAARGEALCSDLGLQALLVTLGERGMLLVRPASPPVYLPARARQVFDVTGAGDTVIAVLAAGLGSGLPLQDAASLANVAAGLVVGRIGVASVTRSELLLALHEHGQGGRGLLAREQVREVVSEARARGERIVMTNGCFDILHAGHVSYLEDAKRRGDRLLVAINDDDSVRNLKGPGRPINPLPDRMAVLAGLAAVDWVVAFSGETPEKLITEVMPDVLVKGGDYRPEEIAGASAVLANGGVVEVLGFQEGRSTSAVVEAIRRLPAR
jgi:D-beta-D-heptose 7-phosphate kinase/D-beta-D-heptose 1-phosphate adenosyltransferase